MQLKVKVKNKEKQAGVCQKLTTMEPGSSSTTCGSSSILMNSGPMSCNRGQGKKKYNVSSHALMKCDMNITLSHNMNFNCYSPSFSCHSDSLWTQTVSWCFDCHPCTDCRGRGSAAASCHNSLCADVLRESWEQIRVSYSQFDRKLDLLFMTKWLE